MGGTLHRVEASQIREFVDSRCAVPAPSAFNTSATHPSTTAKLCIRTPSTTIPIDRNPPV